MFGEDAEFISTANETAQRCERCQFYIMIDSGFGYCRRFPPKYEINQKHWWNKRKVSIHYQEVEWDRIPCGEYKQPNP